MEQERETSDRLTKEESGLDVHHGGQQVAEEDGVQQEADQREGDQHVGPEHPATG
jgi:hypothetical protein